MALEISAALAGGCLDRDSFLAYLRERSPRIREAAAGETARTVRVELEPAQGQMLGRLSVQQTGEQEGRREVRGSDCGSVAKGLALIAAVILDPIAALKPPARTEPAKAAPELSSTASPPAPSPPPSMPPSAPLRPTASAATVSLGAALELATGLGPDPAIVPRAFVGLDLPAPLRGLSVLASVGHAFDRRVVTVDGTAEIALTNIRAEPCVDLWSPRVFQLPACGIIEGDVLDGQGSHTTGAQSAHRLSVELGIGVRPTWILTRHVALSVLVGATVPLARYRFYFTSPDATAYRLAYWAGFAEFGAAWRFW
jgi:hypothetical protein